MTEYTEESVTYIHGFLEGMIEAASIEASEDTTFDMDRWQELYGADIIYASIPAYRSEEAKLNDEDPLTIMDWDEDREIALLSPGAEVPTDRSGSLVFANRTVFRTSQHGHSMFSISDEMLGAISRLREQRSEMLEDVYH